VRDLGSSNGTSLNDVRLGRTGQRIRQGDLIRVGNVPLRVETLRSASIRVGSGTIQVHASVRQGWDTAAEEGVEPPTDRWPEDPKPVLRLMRSGYRLAHATDPDAELQRILDEAVVFFRAQRGGLFLVDESGGPLTLQCISAPAG